MEKQRPQPDGVQALGVSESVQNVWQFAVLRPSQRLLAKVDRYVAAHPELTDVQRGKISDTRKELERQLQGVDEARERARRAQEKNTRLINELATLCPVTSNHYNLRPQAVSGKKRGN